MLFCFSKLLGVRQHGQHAPCPQRQRCPPAIEARSRLHTAALRAPGQSYGRFRARAQPRSLSETPPRSPVAQRLIIALQVLYLVAIFTTSLLCPMLLVHLQQYRAAACWKRPPGTGAPARYPGLLGRAHQASSCAMRLGRTAEPFARSEAVERLEARPTWPTLRRPPHRRRHPGAMGRGRPRLSSCAVRLTDMTPAGGSRYDKAVPSVIESFFLTSFSIFSLIKLRITRFTDYFTHATLHKHAPLYLHHKHAPL